MPRTARIKSVSGYYHIVARGIARQVLFEEDADYLFFLKILKKCKEEEQFKLLAFCLMENHFHLLVKIDNGMDRVMNRISTTYARYYNDKYERIGYLFQDRYKSKAIDSRSYLLSAMRYIHNNPVKAGLCSVDQYRWSSWQYYDGAKGMVDAEIILDMLGGKRGFMEYSMYAEHDPDDGYFEFKESNRLNDSQAQEKIRNLLHLASGTKLQELDRVKRDEALRILKDGGLSIRQIERLTGITRGVVMKA